MGTKSSQSQLKDSPLFETNNEAEIPMNWWKKFAEENPLGNPAEWPPGQRAILDVHGFYAFPVVQVIDWDQIGQLSDHYQVEGDNVTSPNPFGSMTYNRYEGSVPCVVLKSYGRLTNEDYYSPGKVLIVGPQNLYKTFADLIRKEARVIFPDLILDVIGRDYIGEFLKDFPDMKGFQSISEFVQYDAFQDDSGYEILVLRDPRAYQAYGRSEPEFPYYWQIPELKVRSLDFGQHVHDEKMRDVVRAIWSRSGSFRYHTVQEAVEAASKFIEHMMYQGVE